MYKVEEHDSVNAVLGILKGVTTAKDVKKKYDITSLNSVYTWICKYRSQEKSLSLQELFNEIPSEKREENRLSIAISNRLDTLMKEKDLNKKQFAKALGK